MDYKVFEEIMYALGMEVENSLEFGFGETMDGRITCVFWNVIDRKKMS